MPICQATRCCLIMTRGTLIPHHDRAATGPITKKSFGHARRTGEICEPLRRQWARSNFRFPAHAASATRMLSEKRRTDVRKHLRNTSRFRY